MKNTTPLTHVAVLSRNVLSIVVILAVIFGATMVSLIMSRASIAEAATVVCEPLSGDTSPALNIKYKAVFGISTVTASYSNTGAMYFGPYAAGRPTVSSYNTVKNDFGAGKIIYDPPQKPILYPPAENLACASMVNGKVYLQGWVWNDNLGWVSLYCPGDGSSNRGIACGAVKYGVEVDKVSGILSGYAWSNAGWIRMNCAPTPGYGDGNYCATSNHAVKVRVTTNKVEPTVLAFDPADPGALTNANKTALAWTSAAQWMSFAGMGVPLNKLVDTKCPDGTDSCLAEKKITDVVDTDDDVVVVDSGPIVVGEAGEFPVKIDKPAYLGGSLKSTSDLGAVNPVSQGKVRDLVFRNVQKWKKVASTSCGNKGNFLLQYETKDRVFYCKGDVVLSGKWQGNKTIIVDGGNVYINGSLYSDKGQLGIVVLRSKLGLKKEGNVYVGPEVRDLRVQVYADGSVYPYVAGSAIGSDGVPVFDKKHYAIGKSDSLFGQLFIKGMIIADNYVDLPVGASKDTTTAQLKSLGYLRSLPADPGGTPEDGKLPGMTWNNYLTKLNTLSGSTLNLDMKGTDGKTIKKQVIFKGYSSASEESTKRISVFVHEDYKKNFNQAVFIQYEPPAQDLAVFEGIIGGGYKQTGG